MMTVFGFIEPCFSAAFIMDKAILSFTLPQGLKDSSLARMVAFSEPSLLILTSGVHPTAAVMSSNIAAISYPFLLNLKV